MDKCQSQRNESEVVKKEVNKKKRIKWQERRVMIERSV